MTSGGILPSRSIASPSTFSRRSFSSAARNGLARSSSSALGSGWGWIRDIRSRPPNSSARKLGSVHSVWRAASATSRASCSVTFGARVDAVIGPLRYPGARGMAAGPRRSPRWGVGDSLARDVAPARRCCSSRRAGCFLRRASWRSTARGASTPAMPPRTPPRRSRTPRGRSVAVPDAWNDRGTTRPRGYAWYRGRIVLDRTPDRELGLQVRAAGMALRGVRGRRAARRGRRLPAGLRAAHRRSRPRSRCRSPASRRARTSSPSGRTRSKAGRSRSARCSSSRCRDLLAAQRRDDLYMLGAAVLFVGLAIYQLVFWARRREAREHLYVFLFCFGLALYFVNWMPSVRAGARAADRLVPAVRGVLGGGDHRARPRRAQRLRDRAGEPAGPELPARWRSSSASSCPWPCSCPTGAWCAGPSGSCTTAACWSRAPC